MNRIDSPVPEIAALNILGNRLPARKCKWVCSHDGITVAVLHNGTVWCSSFRDKYVYRLSISRFQTALLKSLVAMKVISQAAMDQHIKAAMDVEQRSEIKYDANTLDSLYVKYGKRLAPLKKHIQKRNVAQSV